jgi:formylglycine-generating enzyme required for sulfatase activity
LGRISYRAVTVEENINRMNYRQSDNINYLDGDLASQLTQSWLGNTEGEGEEAGYEEESSEEGEGTEIEKETNKMYSYEKSSMVDDKARVVKGGSWKDRAFYLSPGQRRFLDQAQSADWIGFRCAMDRMGSREL